MVETARIEGFGQERQRVDRPNAGMLRSNWPSGVKLSDQGVRANTVRPN